MKKFIVFAFLSALFSCGLFGQDPYNVQFLPTNVGGKPEFKRVFEQEVIYPETLYAHKAPGKVVINFVIHKDSSVTDVKVVPSGLALLDKEALRLFKLYEWVPAIKEGQYVGTNWSVTFDFDPAKYTKICKQRGYKTPKYIADAQIDTSGVVYSKGVQMPAYEKGNFALQEFIKENLEYPRQAQLSNIQGTVLLSFIVEPTGMMTNIGVAKSLGGGCDQEAVRILEMIKWYPGKHDDKLARVKMTFPFYFVLNSDFRDNAAGEQK